MLNVNASFFSRDGPEDWGNVLRLLKSSQNFATTAIKNINQE